MTRRGLTLGLLVSVGVNLGVLGAIAAGRFADRGAAGTPAAPDAERSSEPTPAEPDPLGPEGEGPARIDGPELGGPELDVPPWRAGLAGAPPVERLADRLGLEGETRERFLVVQRRWFESLLANRRERHELTLELRRELAAERPDRERIGELVERLGEVYAAGEAATAESVLDSRALLDPGQQEIYAEFLRHLADRQGARRGPRRGGRPFGRSGPPPG